MDAQNNCGRNILPDWGFPNSQTKFLSKSISQKELMDGISISEETQSKESGGRTQEYFNALEKTGWYFDEEGKWHAIPESGTYPAGCEVYPALTEEEQRDSITLKQWHKFMSGAGKTLKYIIKCPSKDKDGKKDGKDEIIGMYSQQYFAKQRYEAIKAGGRVKRLGLHLPYHVRFLLDEFAIRSFLPG